MSAELRNRAWIIGGLFAAGLLVWLFLRSAGEDGPDLDQATLLELLRAAEAEAAWPGLDVSRAAAELGTPQAAADFMRAGVVLQDYEGRFADPEAVLATRGANAEDQAALLAALVQAMGFQTRMRAADWPEDPVERYPPATRSSPAHDALVDFLAIDRARTNADAAAMGAARIEAVRAEAATAHGRLSGLADLASPQAASRPDRRMLVEYRHPDLGWTALDPVLPGPVSATGTLQSRDAISPVRVRVDFVNAAGLRETLVSTPISAGSDASISFAPAVNAAQTLAGPPDPSSVALWRAVITTGGEAAVGGAFTAAGRLADAASSQEELSPEPPAVSEAEIIAIDTSAFPEVAVTVRTNAPARTRWSPAHIALAEGGARRAVRVEGQREEPRAVVLVTDVSASMVNQGRIFAAGALGRSLIANLRWRQDFAAVTAAGTPEVQRNVSGVISPQTAIDDFESGLVIRAGDDLAAGVTAGDNRFFQAGDLVAVTDGEIHGAAFERLVEAAATLRGRLIMVVPERRAARFEAIADMVFVLPIDEAQAALTGRALAHASGSSLQVAFAAADGPAGAVRSVELQFAGGAATAAADYEIPPRERNPSRIEVALTRDGRPLGETRTLVALGQDDTPWRLMSQHRLLVSGGRFHPTALMRTAYGEARLAFELGLPEETVSRLPGPGAAMLTLAQGLTALTEAGVDAALTGASLQVVMLSASPSRRGQDLWVERRVDVLADAGLSRTGGARAALAMTAAEGALIDGESVNALLAGGGALVTIDPRTEIPQDWPDAAVRLLQARPDHTLFADADGLAGWLVGPDGAVSARLFQPAAKGARAEQIAGPYEDLRSKLGVAGAVASGVGNAAGVPGSQVGGVVAIIDFNLRMFCFSAVMMGYVGEAIEDPGADYDDWRSTAETECEINPEDAREDFYRALANGLYQGGLGDRATGALVRAGPDLLHKAGESAVNTEIGLIINRLNEVLAAAEEAGRRRPPAHPRQLAVAIAPAPPSE